MAQTVARDLMTPGVLRLPEGESLKEAAAFLVSHEISGALVEDDEGNVVGLLSLTDIAGAAVGGGAGFGVDRSHPDFHLRNWDERLDEADLSRMHTGDEGLTVADVMSTQVYTVDADASAAEVARTMLDSHIHRLLVEENGELVGVISTSDLLRLVVDEWRGT